jgi:hypothetical protein
MIERTACVGGAAEHRAATPAWALFMQTSQDAMKNNTILVRLYQVQFF